MKFTISIRLETPVSNGRLYFCFALFWHLKLMVLFHGGLVEVFLVSRKPYHRGSFLFPCQEKTRRPSDHSLVGAGVGVETRRYCTNNNKNSHLIQYLYEWVNVPSSFTILFYLNLWEALWDTCIYVILHAFYKENRGLWRQMGNLKDKFSIDDTERGNTAET